MRDSNPTRRLRLLDPDPLQPGERFPSGKFLLISDIQLRSDRCISARVRHGYIRSWHRGPSCVALPSSTAVVHDEWVESYLLSTARALAVERLFTPSFTAEPANEGTFSTRGFQPLSIAATRADLFCDSPVSPLVSTQ